MKILTFFVVIFITTSSLGAIHYQTLFVEQSGSTDTDCWATIHFMDAPQVQVKLICHKRDAACHLLMAGRIPYSSIALTPETLSVCRGDETSTYTITGSVTR